MVRVFRRASSASNLLTALFLYLEVCTTDHNSNRHCRRADFWQGHVRCWEAGGSKYESLLGRSFTQR
jgi:hypothetical protein